MSNDASHDFLVDVEQEEDGRWIAKVRGLPGVMACGASRESAIEAANILATRVLDEAEAHDGPYSPFPQNAHLHSLLGTNVDIDGTSRPEVSIFGNRSAFKWLADECLKLAFAGDAAVDSGFHRHLDFESGSRMTGQVCVTLRLATNQEIRSLRRAEDLCLRCGGRLSGRSDVCPHCSALQKPIQQKPAVDQD